MAKQEIVWKKRRSDMFETFAVELQEYTRTGKLPDSCDRDMRYCLELQRERQKEKDIIMKYEFVPRGHFAEKSLDCQSVEDACYKAKTECRTCQFERKIYKDKKAAHSWKENMNLYQMITDTKNNQLVEEEDYVCPNCGAISKVKDLINGCAYCGTYFKMDELFPKVTNFYMVMDPSGTEKEITGQIIKSILCAMPICMILFMLTFHIRDGHHIPESVVMGIFAGLFASPIFGYFLWAVLKIGSLFKEAGRSVGVLVNTAGSDKKFEAQMKEYSPEFSYMYFVGKVFSMLRMIMYAKDARELPIYVGEDLGELFSDIIDSHSVGSLALKKFQVEGDYCYVMVEAYMDVVYATNGVSKKREKFRLELRRNITTPMQVNFSITKIHCKNCAASFDATKQRTCPNCNTKYEIADDDWVVMSVEKK